MKKNINHHPDVHDWFFSLHGGHSKEFCEHAKSNLINIIKKAISLKMPVYGITEHAPRTYRKYLYPEEIEKKLTPNDLLNKYAKYCEIVSELQKSFSNSITLLKGLEIEVVPKDNYVDTMKNLIREGNIEYIVGSVHWIEDIPFDFSIKEFNRAVNKFGLIGVIKKYYEILRDMVLRLSPEIVGHIDLITCFISSDELDKLYPKIEQEIVVTLETIKKQGSILELNTSGYRKSIKRPFPDIHIIKIAKDMGISFTFGDDSHSSTEVGSYIKKAKRLLLKSGITEVVQITRSIDSKIIMKKVPLI